MNSTNQIYDKITNLLRRIVWLCESDLRSSDVVVDDHEDTSEIEEILIGELKNVMDRVNEAISQVSITSGIFQYLYAYLYLKLHILLLTCTYVGVDSSAAPPRQSAQTTFKCTKCGNQNASHIVRDVKSGDAICLGVNRKGCGMVLQDHLVDEGSEKRNFEDTEVSISLQ